MDDPATTHPLRLSREMRGRVAFVLGTTIFAVARRIRFLTYRQQLQLGPNLQGERGGEPHPEHGHHNATAVRERWV